MSTSFPRYHKKRLIRGDKIHFVKRPSFCTRVQYVPMKSLFFLFNMDRLEIDYEIFSTVILSLPLIQEGHLSVSGERMCTVLVNRLED